ncbi:hypothetical protein SAMN06265219_12318 [Gracilimonas mengyeensis]|uniref:Uncharacterized protein n=1 Tax=Gracilimonas mengyeensis TaxID=1302730 RepID=A0A521FLW0_9BACT|nr:hypothetical protein SAMN06265219_12318 [Gracilimonas mengyeensis]
MLIDPKKVDKLPVDQRLIPEKQLDFGPALRNDIRAYVINRTQSENKQVQSFLRSYPKIHQAAFKGYRYLPMK